MKIFSTSSAFLETVKVGVIYLQKENGFWEYSNINFCSCQTWSFPGYWICLVGCAVGAGGIKIISKGFVEKTRKSAILAGNSVNLAGNSVPLCKELMSGRTKRNKKWESWHMKWSYESSKGWRHIKELNNCFSLVPNSRQRSGRTLRVWQGPPALWFFWQANWGSWHQWQVRDTQKKSSESWQPTQQPGQGHFRFNWWNKVAEHSFSPEKLRVKALSDLCWSWKAADASVGQDLLLEPLNSSRSMAGVKENHCLMSLKRFCREVFLEIDF